MHNPLIVNLVITTIFLFSAVFGKVTHLYAAEVSTQNQSLHEESSLPTDKFKKTQDRESKTIEISPPITTSTPLTEHRPIGIMLNTGGGLSTSGIIGVNEERQKTYFGLNTAVYWLTEIIIFEKLAISTTFSSSIIDTYGLHLGGSLGIHYRFNKIISLGIEPELTGWYGMRFSLPLKLAIGITGRRNTIKTYVALSAGYIYQTDYEFLHLLWPRIHGFSLAIGFYITFNIISSEDENGA